MLTTQRLTLRKARMEDAASLAQHANHVDVARWLLTMPHPYSLAHAEDYLKGQIALDRPGQNYVICVEDEAIGTIGTIGEFGYWIGPDHWGQGLVTEAGRAVLAHHFETDGWDLVSSHAKDNTGSGRVLQKCGFRYTGDVERRRGQLDIQNHEHRNMILTRADWEARQ